MGSHRAFLIRATAATLALAGLFTGLTQQQPLTVEKIADDLHIIVGSGGNVAVYTTPEGVILVDDKFERNVPEILEKVKSITPQPVRYILNTHQHGDHTGGNAMMLGSAEILIHENARANMGERKMPGQPRLTFSERTSIHLGGKEVRAYHFGRGHTNGDAVVYFPAHRIVHTGDLFVEGAPFIDYSSNGSGVAWTNTLDRALSLDFERIIPGHGTLKTRKDLIAWSQSFAIVRDRILEMKTQGKSKDEVASTLKVDDLPGWKPSTMFAQRSLGGLYDELR
jgi:glyoxylase-like metal-dependent hydrolase (beta-lactamase superfamily II)